MSRIEVLKTYKIYIGGSFPRTESGRSTQDLSANQTDADGDVKMQESDSVPTEKEEAPVPVPRKDETPNKTVLPPPPPIPQPQPGPSEDAAAPQATEQKWLLPPITPRFQGKKCLVLDLDETLVHSSFKVCYSIKF